MKDKKEKSYWGVKESEIDANTLKKIIKYQQIYLITIAIFWPFIILNAILQFLDKYINHTVLVVVSSIVIAVSVVVIVISIIYIVKMIKLKKQVLQTRSQQLNEQTKDKPGE